MKFNIFFTIRGPAATQRMVPNITNPVEGIDLASVLARLASDLPHNPSLGIETIGIAVELVEESEVAP